MEVSNFGSRAVIFKENTAASKLYVVKAGEVLCLKSSQDRLIPIYVAKEGDIIGESAMIQDSLHTYSAISMAHTQLIEVTSFSFKQVMLKSPDWIAQLLKTMILRFQQTSNLIAENRVIHSSVIDEEFYNSQNENEFKKLLMSKS
jgi:CRP-like cAMP-binding protein